MTAGDSFNQSSIDREVALSQGLEEV